MALALLYRALTRANLLAALKGTMAISGMILFIIVGATTFSQILSFSGASNGLVSAITGKGLSEQMGKAGITGWDEESCTRMIQAWLKAYPGVEQTAIDKAAMAMLPAMKANTPPVPKRSRKNAIKNALNTVDRRLQE